jgi:hypothetical protein
MSINTLRTILTRLLAATGVCAIIAVLAGVLYGALSATGDVTGATAVTGVLFVAVTGLILSVAGQVIMLTLIELSRDRDDHSSKEAQG